MLLVPQAAPILVSPDLVRDEARLRPRSTLPGMRTPAVRVPGTVPVGLLAHLRDPSKIPVGPPGCLGPVARGGGVRPPADPDGQGCRVRARPSCPRDAGQDHADGSLGVQGQRDGRALRCRLGWRLDPVALAQVTRGLAATRSGVLDHARPGQLLSAHRVPTFTGEAAWRLRHEVSPVPSRALLKAVRPSEAKAQATTRPDESACTLVPSEKFRAVAVGRPFGLPHPWAPGDQARGDGRGAGRDPGQRP